jgi:hypothetical protein
MFDANAGVFRTTMQPAGVVSATTDGPMTTWAFTAIVFRSGTDVVPNTACGVEADVKLFHNSYSLDLTIPPSDGPRDVTITVPLAELNNDTRVAVVTATAGPISNSVTVSAPDPLLGESVNNVHVVLPSVPGFVTEVTVTLSSPTVGGDSFMFGTVVATTDCDNVPTCVTPDKLTVSYLSTTKVSLTWENNPSALGYQLRGRKLGMTSWASVTSATNVKIVSNLTPGQTYEWQVRAACPDGLISDWSVIDVFTMPLSKVGADEIDFRLFPSPTSDLININYTAIDDNQALVSVVDMLGRELITENVQFVAGPNYLTYDVQAFESGIYFVRIVEGEHETIRKFVVAR